MDLKYSQIAQASRFSNDKMVHLIKQKLAESENAAVALVFDDKLIVLDENNEQFYSVDYKVENKALYLKNWEAINLIADNDSRLESLAEAYFDPIGEKEVTIENLVEGFKLKYSDVPVRKLLNKTASEKKSMVESVDRIKAIREVRGVREYYTDDVAEIMKDSKIQALIAKVNESAPVQGSVTKLDFNSPIAIAIFEEYSNKPMNLAAKKKSKMRFGNIKKKVANEWTSATFKDDFATMLDEMAESESAKAVLDAFMKQHVELSILEANELEDLILKTTLMIGEAQKSEGIVELFKEYYKLEQFQEMKEDFISRNSINEDEEELDTEEPETSEEPEEKAAPSKETAIDEDSINKILKVFNKISKDLKEKTMESRYVKSFISALEDAKVGSISEGKLKEILDFLTSIYEEAESEKEDESEEE